MAKIYRPPEGIEWNLNSGESAIASFQKYEQQIAEFCKEYGKGSYAGKMIREPVADGYAVYYILSLSPLELIHSEAGDAYRSRWDHRWTAADVKQMADQEEAIAKLFAQKRAS